MHSRPDPEQLSVGHTIRYLIREGIEPAVYCAVSQSLSHYANIDCSVYSMKLI